MRIFLMVIALTGIVLSTACHGSKKLNQMLPKPMSEDHSAGEYVFPSGVYYAYDFESRQTKDLDIKDVLLTLHKNQVKPLEMWYKPGASSCVPPGSEMAMTVMVEPALIVRLGKPNPKMEKIGYQLVEAPSAGSCAFSVQRYRF
ncbi:MAG TPA: hypothetical protein PKE03_06865 [Bacteroidales bacterium]|nr:hypothetical protein [Bacteroidales bacterium]